MKCIKYFVYIIFFILIIQNVFSEENLIKNGDFENNDGKMPSNWKTNTWKKDRDIVNFYIEKGNAYSGEYYFTIENIEDDDSKLLQDIKVKPDSYYKLSCFVKATGIDKKALGANITVLDILGTSNDFKDTIGKWEYVELYGKTDKKQKEMTISLRLGGYGNINTGKASFDDVRLVELKNKPENVPIINFFKESVPQIKEHVHDENCGHEHTHETVKKEYQSTIPVVFLLCLLYIFLFLFLYYHILKKDKVPLIRKDENIDILFYFTLFIAFLIRVIFSVKVRGYPNDISCFQGWAESIYKNGFSGVYLSGEFIDYPPGYLYILWIIGLIRNIFNIAFESRMMIFLIKSPAIIADIISSVLIYKFAIKKINKVIGLCLATLYIFNPAIYHNSVLFGQMDSFLMLFILLSLWFLYNDKIEFSAALYGIAILIKPQVLVLAPIGIYEIIKSKNKKTAIKTIAYFIGTLIILLIPFYLRQKDIFWIFKLYNKTIVSYTYASVNAFNLFSLFGGNWAPLTDKFIFFSYKAWGNLFLLGILAFCIYLFVIDYKKNKSFTAQILTGLLLVSGVYILGARMHERYIFPVISILLLSYIFTLDKRFLFIFLGFTITLFVNQEYVLNLMLGKNSSGIPKDDNLLRLMSIINLGMFVYIVKIIIDVIIKNNIVGITKHNESSENEYLKKIDDFENNGKDNKKFLTRNDYLLMFGLTIVYAVIAFVNLGSLKAPQTCWKPQKKAEWFTVDFGEIKKIERFYYFFTLGQGKYKISFSVDNNKWENEKYFEHDNVYEMIEWKYILINSEARYAKIENEKTGLMLNEIGFFEKDNKNPVPIKEVYSEESNKDKLNNYAKTLDEQHTIAYRPSYMNSMYFDETYHARTALEHIKGIWPTETTHPPLGKVFISFGIMLFGANPFGWRFTGTLFGVLMVIVMYLFGKKLFNNTFAAFCTAFIFTFDFMHFVQTRIATIDVYGVFFIILMYYFMYQYYRMNFFNDGLKKTLYPLLFCGIAFGLGCASKWIVIYGAGGLVLIFLISMSFRFYEYIKAGRDIKNESVKMEKEAKEKSKKIVKIFPKYVLLTLAFCLLFFIIIPVVIYSLSYIPIVKLPEVDNAVKFIINDQKNMYNYHANLNATHPYSSTWWEWPVIRKPMWYYGGEQHLPKGKISSIAAFGNPLVWWIGIICVIISFVFVIKYKQKNMLFILIAFTSQYLPWIIAPRKLVFIYHFFGAVPFMVICLVYILFYFNNRYKWFKDIIYVYLIAVMIVFILFYPVLSGMIVNKAYVANILRWVGSWFFYQ